MMITFRGEYNGRAKLNSLKVVEIFQAKGKQEAIAAEYGVSQSLVSRIKAKKAWPHLFKDSRAAAEAARGGGGARAESQPAFSPAAARHREGA